MLDVGCGTGSLAAMLADRAPGARIAGVDADPEMLARARAKRPDVDWREGRAESLPFADGSVDLVVSSLFFHHLPPTGKRAVAAEILRVLRVGGRLAIADWGGPGDPPLWIASRSVRAFDGGSTAESQTGRGRSRERADGLRPAGHPRRNTAEIRWRVTPKRSAI